tara:strand:+ start:612 stop:1007 length:396 start_codon:yes stop_codon:yes gene_type:complete
MRFAVQGLGSIEDFMRSSPDMGEVAQKAAMLQGKERMLNTALEGQTGVAGIQGNVAAKTGELIGDAQAAAGRDQMWGSIFQTMGQVGGSAISKFGNPGFNYAGGPGSSGTQLGAGGGTVGGLGTYGPNYGK